MLLSEKAQSNRATVWLALSELFTARELQDYDYKWMVLLLRESGMSRDEIFRILDEEVAPALSANLLYNPTPVMDGWCAEEIKTIVMKYLAKKPTFAEHFVPARILSNWRRKFIRKEINMLSKELDNFSQKEL
ncbi:DUF7079 family protein [Kosakonia cowanii]